MLAPAGFFWSTVHHKLTSVHLMNGVTRADVGTSCLGSLLTTPNRGLTQLWRSGQTLVSTSWLKNDSFDPVRFILWRTDVFLEDECVMVCVSSAFVCSNILPPCLQGPGHEPAHCQHHHHPFQKLLLHIPAAGPTHPGQNAAGSRQLITEPVGGGPEGPGNQSGELIPAGSLKCKTCSSPCLWFTCLSPKNSKSKEVKSASSPASASEAASSQPQPPANQQTHPRHKRLQEHEKERKELFSKPPAQVSAPRTSHIPPCHLRGGAGSQQVTSEPL